MSEQDFPYAFHHPTDRYKNSYIVYHKTADFSTHKFFLSQLSARNTKKNDEKSLKIKDFLLDMATRSTARCFNLLPILCNVHADTCGACSHTTVFTAYGLGIAGGR
jgi:hypothetical protein